MTEEYINKTKEAVNFLTHIYIPRQGWWRSRTLVAMDATTRATKISVESIRTTECSVSAIISAGKTTRT